MKTTIELPDELLHRAKVAAAQRQTTLKELITAGLEVVLRSDRDEARHLAALERLQKGFHLGARPLPREQVHERS